MHVSEHYPAFSKKTLLVLTNNELAKIFSCLDREIDGGMLITTPELEPLERITSPAQPGTPNLDAAKQHRREELYAELSEELQQRLKADGIEEIMLCTPEANKNEVLAAMHPDVVKRIKTVVPKNLASMDIVHVLRILFES